MCLKKNSQNILKKQNKDKRLILWDIKTYYKANINKQHGIDG